MGELKLSQEKDILKKSQKIKCCCLPIHLQEEILHSEVYLGQKLGLLSSLG